MTAAAGRLPLAIPVRRGLGWGLSTFIWLLPFHIVVMAILYGGLGLSVAAVRAIAAWKEALVLLLATLTLLRAVSTGGPRGAVQWVDLAVGGFGILAVVYLIGAQPWFAADLPLGAQVLGWRDAVFFTLLYFVGRATPEVAEEPRYLRSLFAVGVVTSVIAILERLFVSPDKLVLLGAARYIQEFLGLAPITQNNIYGLPDNYWTGIGDYVVRRAGSTYLSSQGFAVPFVIILPAATLWLFSAQGRHRVLGWLGYLTLWIGLLLSVTRMTILVCVLQVLLLTVLRRRWSLTVGAGLLGILGLVLTLFIVPGLSTFLWETLTWQTGSSVSHLSDWGDALANLADHPFGVGLGAADQTALRFGLAPQAMDSQYFKYAVEMGLAGLAGYVAILVGICLAGLRASRAAVGDHANRYGAMTAVAALGLALNGLTTVAFTNPFVAYVFFWLAGTAVTAAERRGILAGRVA